MVWNSSFFSFYFFHHYATQPYFQCFFGGKFIYLLSILLIVIILEFYSVCNGLIVIFLLLTNLIFIGNFRGLNLYEYSSNTKTVIFSKVNHILLNISVLSNLLCICSFKWNSSSSSTFICHSVIRVCSSIYVDMMKHMHGIHHFIKGILAGGPVFLSLLV